MTGLFSKSGRVRTMVEAARSLLILVLACGTATAAVEAAEQAKPAKRKQKRVAPTATKTNRDAGRQSKNPSLAEIDEFQIRLNRDAVMFRGGISLSLSDITNPFRVRKRGRFYGSLYQYHRNDFFDARNFFDPVGEPLPEFKRNQFGLSLGAFVADNLQAFGTYEGLRINKGSTRVSLVPTPAMKDGDLSALSTQLVDPFTNEIFVNNRIPASRIHPVAQKMLATIPDPNRNDPDRNFVNNQPRVTNNDSFTARVDYELSRHSKLFGNYHLRQSNEIGVEPLPAFSTNEQSRNQNISLNYNLTSSQNWVISLRLGFNRHVRQELSNSSGKVGLLDSLGIAGVSTLDALDEGYPRFDLSGYADLGLGYGTPSTSYRNNLDLNGDVTYVRAGHKIQLGLDLRSRQVNNHRTGGIRRGAFTFDGYYTGDAFADFLLGIPSTATRGRGSDRADLRQRTWRASVRDDWKISSKFSLSLSLAYNYYPFAHSIHDNVSLFYPVVFEPPTDGEIFVTGSPEAERAGLGGLRSGHAVFTDTNDWEPSIGLAYSPLGNNRLVIRSSYQIDYGFFDINRALYYLGRNYPFYYIEKAESSPDRPDLDLSNPFQSLTPTELTIRSYDPNIRNSYTQEWRLSIQNEFLRNWNLEISYAGRKSTRSSRSLPANVPAPGAGLIQERRPNPGFGKMTFVTGSGSSTGHSMEIEARKRLTSGFSLTSSFDWSRTFSDDYGGNPSNPRNLRAERALTGSPVKRFSLNYIWDLPIGRGRPLATAWAGKMEWLLDGWRLSGITSIRSGRAFTPRLSGDSNNDGVSGDRPDRVGSGALDSVLQSIDQWFDVNDFAIPEEYGFGNSGRNILFGPGDHSWDISLIKRTRVSERGDLIELRVQFFNAFNHTNFDNPSTTLGTSSFGKILNAGDAREIEIALKYTF